MLKSSTYRRQDGTNERRKGWEKRTIRSRQLADKKSKDYHHSIPDALLARFVLRILRSSHTGHLLPRIRGARKRVHLLSMRVCFVRRRHTTRGRKRRRALKRRRECDRVKGSIPQKYVPHAALVTDERPFASLGPLRAPIPLVTPPPTPPMRAHISPHTRKIPPSPSTFRSFHPPRPVSRYILSKLTLSFMSIFVDAYFEIPSLRCSRRNSPVPASSGLLYDGEFFHLLTVS